MPDYPQCNEYRVVTTDDRVWSWSAVDEDQLRREFTKPNRTIKSIQLYSEWELEQQEKQREYQAELEEAAGKEVA